MQLRRWAERLWVMRLIGGRVCDNAGLCVAGAVARLLPPPVQQRWARRAFAVLGPRLQARRHRRAATRLQQLGLPPARAAQLGSHFLAHDWLRRVRLRHLQSLPFPRLQQHLRAMDWHDPQALWAAGAGRRRVVCLLRSGDMEAAVAAVLDRPGAPAHYFIHCAHADGTPVHRTLRQLQRQGHRLEIGAAGEDGLAWRQLQRGATVISVLDGATLATGSTPVKGKREPGPLRLARLARVPVLLLGHRPSGKGAGTLHVLGQYPADSLEGGAPRLHDAAAAFLAGSVLDWLDLDR